MTPIRFWFDPVSPYAYLAFEHLPQALEGLSVVVDHRPVLFGALLKHHAHKGPAEIEPKRQWTFRQVAWQAHRLGIPLDLPAQHPFNPLPLLRLMLAADGGSVPPTDPTQPTGSTGSMGPNRRQVELVMRHVWRGGADPLDPARLAALQADLGLPPGADPAGEGPRKRLRALTDEALALGVFGVPTFECRGHLFWGLDALPMLRACLEGDPWFSTHWDTAARRVPGIVRSGTSQAT